MVLNRVEGLKGVLNGLKYGLYKGLKGDLKRFKASLKGLNGVLIRF